jgi:hypothetical protein
LRSYFEDLKAYHSLRAMQPPGITTPNQVLAVVNESAAQLAASNTVPIRIPAR